MFIFLRFQLPVGGHLPNWNQNRFLFQLHFQPGGGGGGPGSVYVYVYVYVVEMEDMLFGLTDQAIIS